VSRTQAAAPQVGGYLVAQVRGPNLLDIRLGCEMSSGFATRATSFLVSGYMPTNSILSLAD